MNSEKNPKYINSIKEIDEILKSKKISIINFSANWCSPCKLLSPIFKKVSNNNDNINFIKIDIDNSKELINKFEIKSIPTLIFFDKNGKEFQKIFGLVNEKQINDIIEKLKKQK